MEMSTQRPRGTSDILPNQSWVWQQLEKTVRQTYQDYNYQEIRTPVFEHTDVFERGVGETTDIVEKEMYTFQDRGNRSITLRPEGTAGVIRAYVENKLYGQPAAVKLFYIGPMFRYERPQQGRERQFHQFGCEVLGAEGPDIDAEVIALSIETLHRFGLNELTVEVNSVGCSTCRPRHKERMVEALAGVRDRLCKDCANRIDRNPLRIFDCKNGCRDILVEVGAPTILDALCEACSEHFARLQELLRGLAIPFLINPNLVRGLDYYTRTAWEVTAKGAGTVGGGGRYNGLVSQLGGPEVPGIGFAVGMERAILVRTAQPNSLQPERTLDAFVVMVDKAADLEGLKLVQRLRGHGISADRDYQQKGVKAQFKSADRESARFALILGETELLNHQVTVKDLRTGVQLTVPLDEIVEHLKNQITLEAIGI